MLNYELKRIVDCGVFDQLVEETYGKPYCFQQQDGCQSRGTRQFSVPSKYEIYDYENDSIPERINGEEMGVSFKAWLERDPEKPVMSNGRDYVRLFWERNFYPTLEMVVEDLYQKGLIEEGDYTIEIDW